MPGLGETTAMLKRLRRGAQATNVRAGARARMLETRDFGPNPGGLRMLSYAPPGLAAGAPLVVVLHGCTQTGEAYAHHGGWLTLADRYGFAVLAPEQSPSNNPNRCFNWFSSADIVRGEGEAASIAAMTGQALADHDLDPERVFVTGLSAGGAMTSVLLATYPDLYAGGAIVAGLPYGVATSVHEALQAMRRPDGRAAPELGALVRGAAPLGGRIPRISIWHGDADPTVDAANAEAIADQWAWTHGLATVPDETRALRGRTHEVWRAPGSEEVLIERHLIAGLGHGLPLAAGGADGIGSPAPYMLEAGVSAALESLRFWGLAPAALEGVEAEVAAPERGGHAPEPAGVGGMVMASLAGHVPGPVQDVISKALRRAGLMG